MSWLEEYRDRLKQSIENDEQQLAWMNDYNVETRSKVAGENWVDTTEQTRSGYQRNIAAYRKILAKVEDRIAKGEDL